MTVFYYYGVKWPDNFKIHTRIIYSTLLAHAIHDNVQRDENHEKDGSIDVGILGSEISRQGYVPFSCGKHYFRDLASKLSISKKTMDRCLDFLWNEGYIRADEDLNWRIYLDRDFRPKRYFKLKTDSRLSGNELVVLTILLYEGASRLRTDCYERDCKYTSATALAYMLDISKSTYDKTITSLKTKGYVERVSMRTQSGNLLSYCVPKEKPILSRYAVKHRKQEEDIAEMPIKAEIKPVEANEQQKPINVSTQTQTAQYSPYYRPQYASAFDDMPAF